MTKKADPAQEAAALLSKHAELVYPGRNGPVCGVGTSDRRALIDALIATGTSRTSLARIIRAEGIPISYAQLGRHQRKECRCPQS